MAHLVMFRRDKLRRLVEAGRVVKVESYHFDDGLGESVSTGQAIPVRMMPADRRTEPGICYLFKSSFTSNSGTAYEQTDGTIVLIVHSNSNFTFRILPK